MKNNMVIIMLCFLIFSCATVSKTYTPDGREAYSLNCSGTARGWDKCFNAAGNLCGARGYDILDRTGEDSFVAGATSTNIYATKTTERTMLVSCKIKN